MAVATPNNNPLETLAEIVLPALREDQRSEESPIDPTDRGGDTAVRGREVADVVQERQAPATDKSKVEKLDPKAPQKYKVNGNDYTLAELEKAGLMGKLVETHAKHGVLTQKHQDITAKYNEALEKLSANPPKTEPAKPAAPALTNQWIAQNYDAFAREAMLELVKEGLIEPDLAEINPRAVLTIIGQLRFAFDMLSRQGGQIGELLAYLNKDITRRNGEILNTNLNAKLDELVQSGADQGEGNPYKHLNDAAVRKGFIDYLQQKVNPESAKLFGEEGVEILSALFIAYHHEAILAAAKALGNGKAAKTADKGKARGEGGGTRPGAPDKTEPGVFENLMGLKLPTVQ